MMSFSTQTRVGKVLLSMMSLTPHLLIKSEHSSQGHDLQQYLETGQRDKGHFSLNEFEQHLSSSRLLSTGLE